MHGAITEDGMRIMISAMDTVGHGRKEKTWMSLSIERDSTSFFCLQRHSLMLSPSVVVHAAATANIVKSGGLKPSPIAVADLPSSYGTRGEAGVPVQ